MDRRIVIGMIVVISATFLSLAVFVMFKVLARNRAERITHAIQEADILIEQGKVEDAAQLLEAAAKKGPPPELRPPIAERLDGLQDALRRIQQERAQQQEERRTTEAEREWQHKKQERRARDRERELRKAEKEANLRAVGGVSGGLVFSFGLAVGACIMIGLGQLFIAFKDMAINSYLATQDNTSGALSNRTPIPFGTVAPTYKFISFLALIYYFLATLMLIVAAGVILLVVFNL